MGSPRILIVDPEATSLSFAMRCQDEGADLLLYNHQAHSRDIGKNLVPQVASLHAAFAWARQKPTIAIFASSGMGKADPKRKDGVPIGADEFRAAGIPTIGGGSFCDRLENDRIFGEQIAKEAGCRIPPTKTFSTIGQAIAFAKTVGDEGWYFKSDKYLESDATYGAKDSEDMVRYLEGTREEFGDSIPCMLQQKIPGVALSTARWWNGRTWVGPYESTIEHKKFMNDDLGPSTGCSFNCVWFYDTEPKVAKSLKWENLTPLFLKHKAPAGLYDINAIVAEKPGPWGPGGEAYYLEFTPRFGWDSEATSLRLLTLSMPEFFQGISDGTLPEQPFSTSEIAFSVRLSVPPYPFEHHLENKHSALGTPIDGADGLWEGHFIPYSVGLSDEGQLYVADRWGLVGLSLAVGSNLSTLSEQVLAYAKDDLRIPGLQFRTDGAARVKDDAKRLVALGYQVPPSVLR